MAHARRILALAAVSLLLIGVAETPVGAQTDPSTTFTQPPLPDGAGSILGPKPGQGVAPTQSGDRGGVAQLTLFGFIIAAVAMTVTALLTISTKVYRASVTNPVESLRHE